MTMINISHLNSAITIDGVEYEFTNTVNATYNGPVENNILSSAQGVGDGVSHKTGLTAPAVITMTVREVPFDMQKALSSTFKSAKRIEYSGLDTSNGKTLFMKAAVIGTDPDNSSVGEQETDRDINLTLRSSWNNAGYEYNSVN